MKKNTLLFLLVIACTGIGAQNLTKYVNPFIGSANGGNTNPGPVLPWGMLSLSPFNSYDSLQKTTGASPYYYGENKYISGFTHLNMSGVGCGDMGVFCVMPTSGELSLRQPHNSSAYTNEKASPGYYSVNLSRFEVKAELTTTVRTGLSRFTFPGGQANIILNLGLGLTSKKGAFIKRISDTEIEGYKVIGDFCGIASSQRVYFSAKLSKPAARSGIWSNGARCDDLQQEITGDDVGAYFSFDTENQEQIEFKLAVSFISISNARENLAKEQPGFDFEGTRFSSARKWNEVLSRILIKGGTADDKVKFYTALYHTLIHPGIFSDVNGRSAVMEGEGKSVANAFSRYTVFSLWDTYRTVHPFLALLFPDRQLDMVKSLLAMYDEDGWLPKWELAGMETNCMVGDPALPVIADSYLRGIRGFDIDHAYEAMKHNASMPGINNPARPGIDDWKKYGYIPDDAPYTLKIFTSDNIGNEYRNARKLGIVWGSVSTGLEYAIADWNLAQLAKALGRKEDYREYAGLALNYKNNFDPETGFVRPRKQDGSWLSPFDPTSRKLNGFTEGSSWNYSFMVPQDIRGLIKLMGGPGRFVKKLNTCFEKKYFDITNEPDLAYPYLFNYVAGAEWRTQKKVHEIIAGDFHNSPAGLPGNDDCGALSAWLLYAMMGFYPDCAGSLDYQISGAVFSSVTLRLDPAYFPGKTFVIRSENGGSGRFFIESMKLNGGSYKKFQISHGDIIRGGRLDMILKK